MPSKLSAGQAVAAIATQAVYGDGSVSLEEDDALRACLEAFPDLWRNESMAAALKAVSQRVRNAGAEAVLREAIPAVPRHLQAPLLVKVRGLIASDGQESVDENELVARLAADFARQA